MEKNANYAMVGLSTLILFIGMVIFSVWLARLQFARDYDLYDIVFEGPVRGLSQGGEVHFNGIKVGDVTKIALDRTNPSRVIARARVTSDVPIRTDSYATLEPQGITGVNYVQITAGTRARPLLKTVEREKCQGLGLRECIPIVKSQRSALSDLLEGGGTVLARTIEALDRVNKVLSDQNIKTFSATLSDTHAITSELRDRKSLIADAQKAIQSIDSAADQISQLSKSGREIMDTDGRRTVKNLADAIEEARTTTREARALIEKLQSPTADFSATALPQIMSAVSELQTVAESLNRLVNDIQSNPSGVIAKGSASEVKVKP